jgi:DNA-binding MarR family transcriptional regulator
MQRRQSSVQNVNDRGREEALTLEILEAIGERSDVTQRSIARRSGVALGLANSYLKRCVLKGLVKIQQAPANRYLYYLTPKGFAEKSRLTARYLSYSFAFYRRAGESLAHLFALCRERDIERVGLYGLSDLAEIAAIRAIDQGVEVVAVCDGARRRESFLGIAVVGTTDEAPEAQAWVLTDLDDPGRAWQLLKAAISDVPTLAPDILGLETE